MIRKILLGLLAVLVVLQIFQIDKKNPDYPADQDFLAAIDVPADVAETLKTACYDCHSHETKYPWYTYVQPVGWWVKDHINEGKEHLNFSEWTTYEPKRAKHKLEECYEEVEEGEMPLKSYKWVHGDSRLSDEERSRLAGWFEEQYHEYQLSEK